MIARFFGRVRRLLVARAGVARGSGGSSAGVSGGSAGVPGGTASVPGGSRASRAWGIRVGSPRRPVAVLVGLILVVAGALGPSSSPASAKGTVHAPITGSGSTWSANALQAWIRNVWANYQWKITYSESGSTQGRNDFANGTADFGVSEIPYAIANSNEGDLRPQRGFAYMPIVAGGTSFMYNLQIGGKQVTNLRLSGDTLAKIFTGVITVWNDPAVAADNPQLALPATPIVPVVRSDGSGTSAQFTLWMRQQQTALWNDYCTRVGRPFINGSCGVTSNYPVIPGSGFVSRAGANGVAGYVAQAHAVGSITFVEYSYALNAKFPVVKMLNAAGYYIEPTAGKVAVALLQAQINQDQSSPDYLTQDLSKVYGDADPRTYPLSSYSYIILPTTLGSNFTEDKGLTLADFSAYFLCEGQQSAAPLGYSPLPINLVQAGQQQIKKIPGGDPVIKGIADCNNPTFSPDGTNRLALDEPQPPACDHVGPIQCSSGTGGAANVPTDASNGSGGGGANGAGGGTNGSGAGGTNGAGGANGSGAGGANGGGANAAAGPGGSAAGGASAGSGPIGVGQAVVAGTPQKIPVAVTNPAAAVAMVLVGAVVLGTATVLPLIGWRRRAIPAAAVNAPPAAGGPPPGRPRGPGGPGAPPFNRPPFNGPPPTPPTSPTPPGDAPGDATPPGGHPAPPPRSGPPAASPSPGPGWPPFRRNGKEVPVQRKLLS